MKTREEIEEQIKKVSEELDRERLENYGRQVSTKQIRLEVRLDTLKWILEETKEAPLTNIELKELRAIMKEHKENQERQAVHIVHGYKV